MALETSRETDMKIGRMTITEGKFLTDGPVRLDPIQAVNLIHAAKADGPVKVEGLEFFRDEDGWPIIDAEAPVDIPGRKSPLIQSAAMIAKATEQLAKLN